MVSEADLMKPKDWSALLARCEGPEALSALEAELMHRDGDVARVRRSVVLRRLGRTEEALALLRGREDALSRSQHLVNLFELQDLPGLDAFLAELPEYFSGEPGVNLMEAQMRLDAVRGMRTNQIGDGLRARVYLERARHNARQLDAQMYVKACENELSRLDIEDQPPLRRITTLRERMERDELSNASMRSDLALQLTRALFDYGDFLAVEEYLPALPSEAWRQVMSAAAQLVPVEIPAEFREDSTRNHWVLLRGRHLAAHLAQGAQVTADVRRESLDALLGLTLDQWASGPMDARLRMVQAFGLSVSGQWRDATSLAERAMQRGGDIPDLQGYRAALLLEHAIQTGSRDAGELSGWVRELAAARRKLGDLHASKVDMTLVLIMPNAMSLLTQLDLVETRARDYLMTHGTVLTREDDVAALLDPAAYPAKARRLAAYLEAQGRRSVVLLPRVRAAAALTQQSVQGEE